MRNFFSEGDLFDLQHSGDPLSWRGQRGDHLVRCRLDMAAANTLWEECFPSAQSQYLGFESSDHLPLLILFDKGRKRRRGLFRYDWRLCKNEEAKKIISEAWIGGQDIPVTDNLATARAAISAWNRSQQRNSMKIIVEKKKELHETLCCADNNTSLIQDIFKQLNAAYLAEKDYWKQRSRLLWLKLGMGLWWTVRFRFG